MLDDNLVIAFVRARGGFMGLPGKNLMKIAATSRPPGAPAPAGLPSGGPLGPGRLSTTFMLW